MMWSAIVIAWVVIGFIVIRFTEGGWLVMIADGHNVHNTWLAIPCLIICWIFWPIRRLPRWCFLLCLGW